MAYFESSKYQGTVGKILMGIKIVDIDYKTLSFSKSAFRYIVFCLLSAIGGIFINFFLLYFLQKKKLLFKI